MSPTDEQKTTIGINHSKSKKKRFIIGHVDEHIKVKQLKSVTNQPPLKIKTNNDSNMYMPISEYEQKIKTMKNEYEQKIKTLKDEYEQKIEKLQDKTLYYEFKGHELKNKYDLKKYIKNVYFADPSSEKKHKAKNTWIECFVPNCKSKFRGKFNAFTYHLATSHFKDDKITRCLGTVFINATLNRKSRNEFNNHKLSNDKYISQQFVKQIGDKFEYTEPKLVCDQCERKSRQGIMNSHIIRCNRNANCYWLSYINKDGIRNHLYCGSSISSLRFLVKPLIARLIQKYLEKKYSDKWINEMIKLTSTGKLYATKLVDLSESKKAKGCEYKLIKKFNTYEEGKNVNQKLDGRNYEKYMDDKEFASFFSSNNIVHYQITTYLLDKLVELIIFQRPNFIKEINHPECHKSCKKRSSFDTFELRIGTIVDRLDYALFKIKQFNKPLADLIKFLMEFNSTKIVQSNLIQSDSNEVNEESNLDGEDI